MTTPAMITGFSGSRSGEYIRSFYTARFQTVQEYAEFDSGNTQHWGTWITEIRFVE
jgi:hypothetical protein